MKTLIKGSLTLVVLSVLIEAIQSDTNETYSTEVRKGRVNGRIVKLYSGAKPDPILCFSEGFKADPVDCTVFYRCTRASKDKYTVFRFQCGPGTVYDPETEVCNHPINTKRSECGGLTSSAMQENENEIEDQELPSPINTTFPVYTSHKESKNITDFTSVNYKPITNLTSPLITTTERTNLESSNLLTYPWTDSVNKTQHVMIPLPTMASNTNKSSPCIADGFMGDNENCRKFYRCVSNSRGGFVRYEFLCSESTVWDDNMQSCNHAWAVRNRRCGKGYFSNKDNSTNYDKYSSDLVANKHIQNNYGSKVNDQQEYYNNKIYEETNLQYGIKLSNEKVTSNKQNNNISTTSMYQELPYTNKETEIKVQNDNINNMSQYHTTSSPYSSNNFQQNNAIQTVELGKNIKCTRSGFMADADDCKKFYRCVDNGNGGFTKYEFSCSQETVWDKKIEACNYASAVEECNGISLENSTMVGFTKNPTNINTLSTIKDENDYGYGNHINQEHDQTSSTILTTISLLSTTEATKATGSECTSTGFFGDLNDCQKFYRCIDDDKGTYTKYDYKCGQGTLWDQNIEACNHAWAVKSCGQNTITNTTQTTNAYDPGIMTTVSYIQTTINNNIHNADYNTGYNHHQSETTVKSSTDISKTTLKNPGIQKKECQSSGFMGDSHDCKKFYRCVDNGSGGFTQYEFSCGESTVWDPEIEACNHAWAVKQCGGSIDMKEEVTTRIIDYESNNEFSTQTYNTFSTAPIPGVISDNEHSTPTYSSQITVPIPIQASTTNPTMIMNDNSKCETNGFMGDKLDCKKFYRCVDSGSGDYVRYEFSCGEGTVWDPKIQACNHAWAVEECGGSTHVQPTHNIDVSERPTKTPSYENENGYITQSTAKIDDLMSMTTLRSSTVTTTVINSRQECLSSGFMGDRNDCKKFYRCVDEGNGAFTRYEFSCGQGTVWDPKIKACNHEWAVEDCGMDLENNFETTTSSVQTQNYMEPTKSSSSHLITQTQQSHTPVYETTSTVTSNMNLFDCTSEGFFANPNDCKKFFRCVNDDKGGFVEYEFSCGDGTIWVQEIQSCDHDTDALNCTYASGITTTEKYEISASTHNSITFSTTNRDEDRNPNNDKCVSEGFYPNLNNCQYFYRCVDNGDGNYTKYEFSCAEGTAWDINTKICNDINKVKSCRINESPNNNIPVIQDEQVSESEQNMSTTKATTSVSSAENIKPTNQNVCEKEGYYGNIEDCRKFYRCVSNEKGDYTKYDYTCGEGTIWDQDIIACNHPQDVTNPSCKSNQDTASNQDMTSTTISSTSLHISDSSTNLPETTSNPINTSSTLPSNKNETNCYNNNTSTENSNNETITCQKAGFYAHPSDCKKFYRCVDWENNGEKYSIFYFECGDGTIWDPALETCNHVDSVYPPRICNGTLEQNQNMNESSSTTEKIPTTTNYNQTSSNAPESTTQQTTIEQTTPQKLTTQEISTSTQTTQKSTTRPSTTEKSTTQQEITTSTELTTQASTTEKSTTQQVITTTTEFSQTTTQTTQEQTTKSSTEETTSREETTVTESNTVSTTTESSDQTSTTDQILTSTQQLTTEENISQTEIHSSTTEVLTTESQQQSSTQPSASEQECPETSEDQFLLVCPTSFKRHPKYCNLFYQCTEDNETHEIKVATFHCPNNTIYDESKVQCVEEGKSDKKCNGQMAQKRRVKRLGITNDEPIVVTKESMACPNIGHFPFEKHEECSAALFKCELTKSGKLRGFVYKCPEGFIYWAISRRCEPINKIRDCKKPSDVWKKRNDIPVEEYNVAR